jgi:hypothetical protein
VRILIKVKFSNINLLRLFMIIYLIILLTMYKPSITQFSRTGTNDNEPGATLDKPQIRENEESGVTLGEQQQSQQILPNEFKLTVSNKRATSHLNDKAWSLDGMLSRQNYVSTVVWSTTDTQGSQLAYYNVIDDLLKLDIAATPFQRFRYWRADSLTVHVQLTANRFLSGRILVYFYPSMTLKTNTTAPSLSNAVLLQHAWLDPSGSTAIDLVIPFNFYKGWLNLDFGDCLGQVGFLVFNSLGAAVGTTPSVDLKTFVSFQNSEFKVPIPGGVGYSRPVRKQSGLMKIGENFMHEASTTLADIVKSVMPANIVGDLIGGLLDRPEDPTDPQPIVRKDQGYLSNARGIASLEKLTLEPSAQQLCDEEHFATTNDELNIDYLLKKKYSYVNTVTWAATDEVGTILFHEAVGPLLNLITDQGFNIGTRMIDYIAKLFHFWRGSLKYMIDIVGTQFHEGRLDLVYLPGVDTFITDYPSLQSVYLGSVVVRNGQNSMALECPFLSDTPWKQVYYGGVLSNTNPLYPRFDDFSLGQFQIVVASVLRAPVGVTPNVSLNIFQSAGDDFEVCTTSYYNSTLVTGSFSRRVEKQSGAQINLNNNAENITSISLAASRAPTGDMQIRHFGDSYKSLRELAKRYTFVTTQAVNLAAMTPTEQAGVINGVSPVVTRILIDAAGLSLFPKPLMSMFRTFRGPMRFKIKLRTNKNNATGIASNNYGYVNYIPQIDDSRSSQPLEVFFGFTQFNHDGCTAMPAARYSDNQVAEFEVEYAFHTPVARIKLNSESLSAIDSSTYWSINLECFTYITDISLTSSYYLDVYMAFGDTTHLGTFIGLPPLQFLTDADGASPFPDRWITPTPLEEGNWTESTSDEEYYAMIERGKQPFPRASTPIKN